MELFVSEGLIQSFFGMFDGHWLISCNIPCFYRKTSTWTKGNKDGNSTPHNCCLIIVLQCSGRTISIVWLCNETSNNKIAIKTSNNKKYLNVLHHKSSYNTLFLISCISLARLANILLLIFGNFDISAHFNQKQLVESLMFICMQKMNSIPNFVFEKL